MQHDAHQAAVPRRSRRQPPALAGAQGRARQAREGRDHAAALKAVEDREIEALIKKQEAAGLQSITDGEYRRASWQTDFLRALDGVETYVGERAFQFHGADVASDPACGVNKKLGGYTPHPMIEHYKFVQSHTKATPKMTIPSPSTLHFRFGRKVGAGSRSIPTMDDFYRDLGQTWSKTVARLSPTPAAATSSSTRPT